MCWSRGGRARGGWGYARQLGAEAIQVFVPNPRGWALSAGDPRQDAAFRDEVRAAGLPVVVHAPYLINVASPGQATWQRVGGGTAAFAGTRGSHRRPGRGGAHRLGGRLDREGALRREREALPPGLGSLGALGWHPRAGVCVDPCHVFAAGHDRTARRQLRNGRTSVPPTEPATASGCSRTARLTKSLSTWRVVSPLGGR